MKNISELLAQKNHRPFPYPDSSYKVYQEWHDAVFLHWEIDMSVLHNMLPEGIEVDTLDGKAYISLVAFKAENSKPRYMTSVPFISDFLEANIRTYVVRDGIPGIYFYNMKSDKAFSAAIFRNLTGFPYYPSNMHQDKQNLSSYQHQTRNYYDLRYEQGSPIEEKSELDRWLTERYCVYLNRFNKLLRFDVHHEEWPLQQMEIKDLRIRYHLKEFTLKDPKPVLAHYSKGVEVVAWFPKII